MAGPTLALLSLLFACAHAATSNSTYTLADSYSIANGSFWSGFEFQTITDPTQGLVQYVDLATALTSTLTGVTMNGTGVGSVYMGVDHNVTLAPSQGRPSIRAQSNKAYNHGLFILDAYHMPFGCGTWPAFWLLGPNWPNGGEIDVLEGVNTQTTNTITLHTSDGCSMTNSSSLSSSSRRLARNINNHMDTNAKRQAATATTNPAPVGVLTSSDCYISSPAQPPNIGCSYTDPSASSYGAGFNAQGGGVYAVEWTSAEIAVYFFDRTSIPADIVSGNPQPAGWPAPRAYFGGSEQCDLDAHFQNMNIVFDTTLCGSWAGVVWNTTAGCSQLATTCEEYVQNNPAAFADAYWEISSLEVYQTTGS